MASYWLYGLHSVQAALENPERRINRLLLATDAQSYEITQAATKRGLVIERVEKTALHKILSANAVHQGAAIQTYELEQPILEEIADANGVVVVLDQVTDPHNVGAIIRTAAAFGVLAVVGQTRNAPPENGTLAKAASGGLEHIPYILATNIARALETLKEQGFWCYGLDSSPDLPCFPPSRDAKTVLVFGAEGEGLRQNVRQKCDGLLRLNTSPTFPSLNVSNAVAVALGLINR
jgi:23S rRNA (guanosine2251-2'-O)-methyltransferase